MLQSIGTGAVDLIEEAWLLIDNAGEGNWTKETKGWQRAAARWRKKYHKLLENEKSISEKKEGCKINVEDEKDFEEARSNMGKATKQFREEQGETPSGFAFQAGARWGWLESRRTLREKIKEPDYDIKQDQN